MNKFFEVDVTTLNPTKKLYYDDAYLRESGANIVAVVKEKDFYKIVLDETIFYAEGGGQPGDRGEINGINVFDVQEKKGIIYHYVKEIPEREKVHCKIDFPRRFDFMQQHSGEHALSGIILKLFGGANKGFHIGEKFVTIDINIKDMTEEMFLKAEEEANRYIFENQEVTQVVTDTNGLKQYPVRKEVTADEDIRVVLMGEVDCCACCGTHVRTLGEVGIIKIIKAESYKGMTRIYLLCGNRALKDYREKNDIIKLLKKELSAEEPTILSKVQKQREDISALKKQSDLIRQDLAKNISHSLDSKEVVTAIFDNVDFLTLSHLEMILLEKSATVILATTVENKITTATKNAKLNPGQFFKENIKTYNGKGGGSKDKAQGSFETKEDVTAFYNALVSEFAK